MSLFPDDRGPTPPSAKFKISVEERRVRDAERLRMIRLRMAIERELDDRGTGDLCEIAAALGLPAKDVEKLFIRRHWREGDLALLEAAAAWLGLQVLDQASVRD
jgi:hypothetical protein